MNGLNRVTIGGYVAELGRYYETSVEERQRLTFIVVIPERVVRRGREQHRKTVVKVVHTGKGTARLWQKLYVGDYVMVEGKLRSAVTKLKARFLDTGKTVLRHGTSVTADAINVIEGKRKIYKVHGEMVTPGEDEAQYDVHDGEAS